MEGSDQPTQQPQTASSDTGVSVNMNESVVENLNINADVYSQNEPHSKTTGTIVNMYSGEIHNLTATTVIHQNTGEHPSLTEQELARCRDDLRSYYKTNCKIRLLPWLKRDPRNRLEMKDLFTNLYLIYEVPNAIDIQVHIQHYSEILPSPAGVTKRALIRGKAGAGKTTLLEKLALEWAEGRLPPSYNDIPLFFLLKMKRIMNDDTLIDAVFRQRLFGCDIQKFKSKLSNFVDAYPEKVIILLDAVDEYSGYDSDGHIDRIIHNDSMRGAFVVVTTRPWRAFQILDKSPDTYSNRNYEVKGYTQNQVSEYYVNRFFENKPDLGKSLLKQLNETGLDTGIATIPIMCMLICVVFRQHRVLPNTMSELYQELHRFLLRHYDEDKNDSETKVCKTDQLVAIEKLGELALNGLLHKKLSFEECEFVDANVLGNACRIGLVVQSNSSNMPDDDAGRNIPELSFFQEEEEERNYYEFFHKTFQEWFGASYLAGLSEDTIAFKQACERMFTDMTSCLDKELLLRFLSGAKPMVAEMVTKQLVLVLHNSPDLRDYNENKLDLQKTKFVQEFIELVLKCNRESKSEGGLNESLNAVFDKCFARFTNVSSMTFQAIAYMLAFGGATENCTSCNESLSVDCTHKLRIKDLKIGNYRAKTDDDIDHLWGEFEAVEERYNERCKNLSKLPDSQLQTIFEQVKDVLPDGVQHLPLPHKLAFADTCEFMQKWKGDYSHIRGVLENIRSTEITNLTINGVDLSEHCAILCTNLKNMKSLKKLDLGSTSLEPMHCRFIGEMLESLKDLCVLNLNKNKLKDINEIVQRLQYLPCLTRLDLETTHLTTGSIAALGQNLKWVSGLERFYIRSSPLLNEAVDDLVDGLQHISDLRRLNITLGDQLSYDKINILVKCLSRIRKLELVFIDGLFSPIIDNVFRLLATDLLPSLTQLKSLRFQGRLGLAVEEAKQYCIRNETAKVFATNLKRLPNLMALRLTYLWIEEEGLDTIRSEVSLRQQENNRFQFKLYPDDKKGDSTYVPQAVLNYI